MDKAAVFIDGGYFAKILQGFGEPRLNFEDFSNELCKRSNAERFRTYFYDCMPYQGDPPTPEEKRRYKDKQSFITYLSKLPRFEVRLGKLSRFDSICNHCGSKTRKYKKKGRPLTNCGFGAFKLEGDYPKGDSHYGRQ